MNQAVENLLQRLQLAQPVIAERDRRYRGHSPLRFTVDEVEGDLRNFHVNLGRLAVTSVAERMRVKSIEVVANGRDVSAAIEQLWSWNGMGQALESALVDALAVGSAYLVVWVDRNGSPVITVESAEHVITASDPITRETTEAVKRWYERDSLGVVVNEHVIHYLPDEIVRYVRGAHGDLVEVETIVNTLGVVPVVPLINYDRINDEQGYSVLDDLGDLIDGLSKIIADMLTASEAVARPKRWATGVELEDADEAEFTADGGLEASDRLDLGTTAKLPFSDMQMWLAENEGAKFGQLPGADLTGYKTAVEVLLQQIMSVSALPAHMVGITSANPASAEAIRSAEAALTARVASRIRVFGYWVENAVQMLAAIHTGEPMENIGVWIKWADPATSSPAQEADAITKLYSLGVIDRSEAREKIGIDAV